jgi:hypothetical protein
MPSKEGLGLGLLFRSFQSVWRRREQRIVIEGLLVAVDMLHSKVPFHRVLEFASLSALHSLAHKSAFKAKYPLQRLLQGLLSVEVIAAVKAMTETKDVSPTLAMKTKTI